MLGPLAKNGSGESYSNNFESEATRAFLRRHDASRLQSLILFVWGLMTSNLGSRLPFLMYQRSVSTQAVIHFRCFPHFNSTSLTSGNSNKQLLWSFVSLICGESSRGIYPLAAFSLYSAIPPSFAVSSSVQRQPMGPWRLGTKKAANVGERRLAFSHCLWPFGRATTLATTCWMFLDVSMASKALQCSCKSISIIFATSVSSGVASKRLQEMKLNSESERVSKGYFWIILDW